MDDGKAYLIEPERYDYDAVSRSLSSPAGILVEDSLGRPVGVYGSVHTSFTDGNIISLRCNGNSNSRKSLSSHSSAELETRPVEKCLEDKVNMGLTEYDECLEGVRPLFYVMGVGLFIGLVALGYSAMH